MLKLSIGVVRDVKGQRAGSPRLSHEERLSMARAASMSPMNIFQATDLDLDRHVRPTETYTGIPVPQRLPLL